MKLRAFILEAIPGLSASQLLNAASPRDVSPSDHGGGERAVLRRFQGGGRRAGVAGILGLGARNYLADEALWLDDSRTSYLFCSLLCRPAR